MARVALHSVAIVIALAFAIGCSARGAGGGELAVADEPLIYGADDRLDWYAETDTRFQDLASESSVAFIDRTLLARAADGTLRVPEDRYGELYDLCPGTRFADQPSVAECSGVLIAPDLVLTAAHCMRALPCEEWALVFGYRYTAPEQLNAIHERDVYSCAGVVALDYVSSEDEGGVDYAVLQLDRAVGDEYSPAPFAVAEEPLEPGAEVVVIGNGAGLPTKIDEGGKVADGRAGSMDYFVTDSDDFHGGSGSSVFDRSGNLRGVVARGAPDYQMSLDGCEEVRTQSVAQEHVTYAERALDGLCASARADAEPCAARRASASDCAVAIQRAGHGHGGATPALWLLASIRLRRRLARCRHAVATPLCREARH